MSLNREQIDRIKQHFARKSTQQLTDIRDSNDLENWSAEAFEAAREVVDERNAGRAEEPIAIAEPAPVDGPPWIELLLLGALPLLPAAMAVSGLRARRNDPVANDVPVQFGPKTAWLAIDTTDSSAVAEALRLREVQASTWSDGLDAADRNLLFITPPLGQWTLAVGAALFPSAQVGNQIRPLLEKLSEQFGEAQYFCSHSDVQLHVWARAVHGRLVRGFGWLGAEKRVIWDEGAATREEGELDLSFGPEPHHPTDESVFQMAYRWSIDPSSLDENYKEPVLGMVGVVPQ